MTMDIDTGRYRVGLEGNRGQSGLSMRQHGSIIKKTDY